ncbi:MAG: hypothetical protein GX442_17680 [Candidatus Riflebacteria bacterium]|nr:hypothetical protein [Candidatus Riflebacteria bacterium]
MVVVLALVLTGPAARGEIPALHEVIELAPDGSARVAYHLQVAVPPAAGAPTGLRLPLPFAQTGPFLLEGATGWTASRTEDGGVAFLDLAPAATQTPATTPTDAAAPAPATAPTDAAAQAPATNPIDAGAGSITVRFDAPHLFKTREEIAAGGKEKPLPFGDISLAHTFVNTSGHAIASFSLVIALPEGFIFQALDEYSPKPGKSDPGFPYRFARLGERHSLELLPPPLRIGDRASVKARIREASRPWLLLVALAALALAWLLRFRPGGP